MRRGSASVYGLGYIVCHPGLVFSTHLHLKSCTAGAMLRLAHNAHSKFLPAALANGKFTRRILIAVSTFVVLSVLLFLSIHRDDVSRKIKDTDLYDKLYYEPELEPTIWCPPGSLNETTIPVVADDDSQLGSTSKVPPAVLPARKGDKKRLAEAPRYVKAILDSNSTEFQKFDCPALSPRTRARYAYLRKSYSAANGVVLPKYFFALDVHEIASLLPQLLGSLVDAIRFLGPQNCVVSIVEGRSGDGTYEILRSLGPEFEKMGLRYFFQTSDIHPQMNSDRIVLLAELRNMALRDIYEQPQSYAPDTTIIFSNDIWLCTEDVLELVHQQFTQEAHMTCAMDFNLGPTGRPRYYDGWVGRSITGNSFFRGWWEGAPGGSNEKFLHVPFWDDEPTSKRFQSWQPTQVYACWNGITALTAKPFMDGTIRFRGVEYNQKECFQGEPTLLAKDLWFNGYGRIAVVPTINTAYSYDHMKIVRKYMGGVSDHLCHSDVKKIVWKTTPPDKVKCKPDWATEDSWVPWNQSLVPSAN